MQRLTIVIGIFGICCVLAGASGAVAGSVTGKIVYDDRVPPPGKGPLKAIAMDADPVCAKKHDAPVPTGMLVLGDGNALGNVFVQVKNPPGGDHQTPSEPVVIDQKGCIYVPRVAGVMVGQPLQFKNSDGILHNVHGLPKSNREFNIGMPPTLTEKNVTLNKPEPAFKVKCDVHPWMNSFVAVMTHPYFAVTGADGRFELGDLPAGTYTIEAWHEKLGVRTAEVKVDGGAVSQDFAFKIPK